MRTLTIMRQEARKTHDVSQRIIAGRAVTCTHVREPNGWDTWHWTLDGKAIHQPTLEAALGITEVTNEHR